MQGRRTGSPMRGELLPLGTKRTRRLHDDMAAEGLNEADDRVLNEDETARTIVVNMQLSARGLR